MIRGLNSPFEKDSVTSLDDSMEIPGRKDPKSHDTRQFLNMSAREQTELDSNVIADGRDVAKCYLGLSKIDISRQ